MGGFFLRFVEYSAQPQVLQFFLSLAIIKQSVVIVPASTALLCTICQPQICTCFHHLNGFFLTKVRNLIHHASSVLAVLWTGMEQ